MKKLLALLALTATTVAGTPAFAQNTIQDHQRLKETLERLNVPVFVNDQEYCDDNWGGGAYVTRGSRSAIMVCQDEGKGVRDGQMVGWTANDLDSLRHEAHHVLQDCTVGYLADGRLGTYINEDDIVSFVKDILPQKRIAHIIETYTERGADEETVVLELEAFAVAEAISASQIARSLNRVCR